MEKHRFLAIDIGSDSVKVASAYTSNDTTYIENIRQSDFSKNTLKHDAISHGIKSCIDDIQKSSSVNRNNVYMNLLNPYIEVVESAGVFVSKNKKNIINKSDIDKVIASAVDNVDIPDSRFILTSFVNDWVVDDKFVNNYPINMYGNRIEGRVNLITCSQQSKNFLVNLAEGLSLNIEKLYPCIFSLDRALLSRKEREKGVILLDIGTSYIDVIAYKDSSLVCVFTYPHGSKDITEELSVNFNISFEDAENIKREHSVVYLPLLEKNYEIETKQIYTNNYMKINRNDVATVCSNKMMEILITIKRKIKAFEDDIGVFKGGVVVTGGGVLHRGFCELMEHVFRLPVNIGICDRLEGLDEEFVDPRYSTLLSLVKAAERDYVTSDEHSKNTSISIASEFKGKVKGIFRRFLR